MINWKFLKLAFKRIWILIVVMMVLIFAMLSINFSQEYIADYRIEWNDGRGGGSGMGAGNIMDMLYFQTLGLIFFAFYGLIAAYLLVCHEVVNKYISSWLTTPMSRWTIFNTKLASILIGELSLWVWSLLVQILTLTISAGDFKKEYVGPLFLTNLSFLGITFLVVALIWCLTVALPSNWSLLIAIGCFIWFAIAATLSKIGGSLELKKLEIFKYFTITTLFNNALTFTTAPTSCTTVCLGELMPYRAGDFAWQIPTMFIVGSGALTGAGFIFKHRSFNV